MLKAGISVIIPTYNRSALLRRTLDSLCDQTLDTNHYEVIVIDDGSTDDTESAVAEYHGRINIKYFYQEDLGFRVAKARNTGIHNSVYRTTLFFDSGMIAAPELLQQHVTRHSRHDQLVLIGLAYGFEEFTAIHEDPVTAIIGNNSVLDAIEILSQSELYQDCRRDYLQSIDYALDQHPIPWILFWTCHASCPTALLKEIGGFDEAFTRWGGEDVELAIRMHNHNAQFEVIPEAQAIHYPHQRDPVRRRDDSYHNRLYIHRKHQTYDTFLLTCKERDWPEIVVRALEYRRRSIAV